MTTPTPTQIREALFKSADHFEGNPGLFDFYALDAPPDCGTPAFRKRLERGLRHE